MVTRLQDRCLCTKVYVSPSSKSDEPFLDRDKNKDNSKFVNSITGCNGDMKALRSLLAKKFKPIRLVVPVIDYAGFSTEPNNVRQFFEQHTQVKELVVDHGITFEIFEQNDLCENEGILSRFNCRSSPKHRSMPF
ncbi:hypothetical protein DM01DRAFT_32480 [Hesseltinella vesiculosa]|uniref:Uncharacterized protein n=1 Tax=Hesseltinella vesiculosa TaxID=101127 RepID=A0A1X2GUM0_9FUNG|nr:hypothetical protein DM01DRAFT_32480 [Hesseltinella vesiculosa]